MLRPGGFPECSPADQKKFDAVLAVVTNTFDQFSYEHIWTPAVEPVEILKRGGDIVDKQVYGLYGLAQGPTDTKEYALHFDLTIPLARYILDHQNELSFPFKRYQIQPVRRGERTKRGRYKEFWQFDVDVVWPSTASVGVWYDIETIFVLDCAMQRVVDTFGLSINRVCKISHIGLTKSRLRSIGVDTHMDAILGLLDNYYKYEQDTFTQKLIEVSTQKQLDAIVGLLASHDMSVLSACDEFADFQHICTGLSALGVPYEYDLSIVRGHSYYKGMVCEWFHTDDIALGSLAGGGRYNNVTDFIDPKHSFSGVGTSLGRFVYLAIDQMRLDTGSDQYLFINFAESFPHIVTLYRQFVSEGKQVDLYPTPAKFGKQLEYATKKGILYAIILGPSEVQQCIYTCKNITTGEEITNQLPIGLLDS